MGSVKNTRITSNNKVEYTISVDYEEALLLKGHITNMHIFSEDSADIKANIISRGKGETKYLRIPSKISKDLSTKSGIKCLRIDSKEKIIIYAVVDKP